MFDRFRKSKGKLATVVAEVKKGTAVLVPKSKESWIVPEATFLEITEAFEKEALSRESILYMAAEVCGLGIFTTGSEYAKTFKLKENDVEKTPLELVNDKNEEINLDEMMAQTSAETLADGNCFWDITDLEYPVIIPISSVARLDMKEKVLVQTANFNGGKIPVSNIIHFRRFPRSGSPLGIGKIEPLLKTYSESPNILETMALMRKYSVEAWDKFANPFLIVAIPGLPDTEITALNTNKNTIPKSGDRYFTNLEKTSIVSTIVDRAQGWDNIQESLFNQFLLSVGNPYMRSLMTPGFSPGSVQAVGDLHRLEIASVQRIIKRQVEKYWRLYLKKHDFDPAKANIRLNYGVPIEKEISIEDIIKLKETNLITEPEARKMLKKAGFEVDIEVPETEQ